MDRKKTIEQLENQFWPAYDYETNLIERCHELRKKPVELLDIEELRLLIGQQIGLEFIVEIAIEKLSEDVLAEGHMYPGDLLNNVLQVDKAYWSKHKNQWLSIDRLIKLNDNLLQSSMVKTKKFYDLAS